MKGTVILRRDRSHDATGHWIPACAGMTYKAFCYVHSLAGGYNLVDKEPEKWYKEYSG